MSKVEARSGAAGKAVVLDAPRTAALADERLGEAYLVR